VRTSLISALALTGLMASAQAGDLSLGSVKDPLPDSITWHGVTVYGAIDVGDGYESNGLATSGSLYSGQGYNIYGQSLVNGKNNWALTNNALSQSTIGVKIEENIGMGMTAIGRLETGFNPISGEIGDACKSLVEVGNALAKGSKLQAFGDGSRCGQALNGEVYVGVANPTYGTIKYGRQQSLALDAMANFDPQALSYSMSLLGWSGFSATGAGSTETARWDNSLKYQYQYGPVHAAFAYADGAEDSSLHGDSYAASLGGTYKGLYLEGVFMDERKAVNAQLGTVGSPSSVLTGLGLQSPNANVAAAGTNINDLYYFLTNNEAWAIMGKYTFDFGGGFKDAEPVSKLTIYAGYNHTDQSDGGNNNLGAGGLGDSGGTTIGGYILSVDNVRLLSTRTLETEWVGARLETGPWSFTGAYYHVSQNSFSEQNWTAGSSGTPSTGGCAKNAFACSGDTSTASFLVDYAFSKHFDTYAGVAYSTISGGLAHSSTDNTTYANGDNTTFVSGVRLKF